MTVGGKITSLGVDICDIFCVSSESKLSYKIHGFTTMQVNIFKNILLFA